MPRSVSWLPFDGTRARTARGPRVNRARTARGPGLISTPISANRVGRCVLLRSGTTFITSRDPGAERSVTNAGSSFTHDGIPVCGKTTTRPGPFGATPRRVRTINVH